MGVVYKAIDTRLDRPVALKFLNAAGLADPARRGRFIQEARAASALNHPNITAVDDIDATGGEPFMAMEFVPGKTLQQRIGRKGLPLRDSGCVRVEPRHPVRVDRARRRLVSAPAGHCA
jgi:serine/threonine protein kinase